MSDEQKPEPAAPAEPGLAGAARVIAGLEAAGVSAGAIAVAGELAQLRSMARGSTALILALARRAPGRSIVISRSELNVLPNESLDITTRGDGSVVVSVTMADHRKPGDRR